MRKRYTIDVDWLRRNVRYEPDTGRFYSVRSRGNLKEGDLLGRGNGHGYLRFSVCGKEIYAHRAAFVMVHGFCPDVIDHINGDKTDNRISNLRAADCFKNNRNSAKKSGTASRFRGVSRRKDRWRACIRTDGGRHLQIKECKNEVEAAYWYDLKSLEHHGEYGRRNFLPLVQECG